MILKICLQLKFHDWIVKKVHKIITSLSKPSKFQLFGSLTLRFTYTRVICTILTLFGDFGCINACISFGEFKLFTVYVFTKKISRKEYPYYVCVIQFQISQKESLTFHGSAVPRIAVKHGLPCHARLKKSVLPSYFHGFVATSLVY